MYPVYVIALIPSAYPALWVRQREPNVMTIHSLLNLKIIFSDLKMVETLKLQLQFGGGAELLFDKIKKREIELPPLTKYFPDSVNKKWTIKELLVWIKDNLLRERPELFLQVGSYFNIFKVLFHT